MPIGYKITPLILMIILMISSILMTSPDLAKKWQDKWASITVSTIIAAAVVVGWICWE